MRTASQPPHLPYPPWVRAGLWLVSGALLALAPYPTPATAQPIAPSTGGEARRGAMAHDRDKAPDALTWIGALATPVDAMTAQQLVGMLTSGQRDAVTDAALAALWGSTGEAEIAIVRAYTRHRRTAARRAAYRTLAQLPGKQANHWLANGLRDAEPGVRAQCALALGARVARGQVPWLLLALELGVLEAAAPVGKLAPESELARVHALLGRVTLGPLLSGYRAWLARADVSETARLGILARLEEVAGPEVARFMQALVAADGLPEGRLRTAAEQIGARVSAGLSPPNSRGRQ